MANGPLIIWTRVFIAVVCFNGYKWSWDALYPRKATVAIIFTDNKQSTQDPTFVSFGFKFRTHLGGDKTTGFFIIYNHVNHTEKKLHTKLARYDPYEKKKTLREH